MNPVPDLLSDVVFARLIQFVGVLCLIGALAGFSFVLLQMMRTAPPEGAGERNWRFLFSCWADSVAIMILYGAMNFVWLYGRFAEMTRIVAYEDPTRQYLTSQYMMLVVEVAIDAIIVIIAIRLFLKIRRFLSEP